MFAILLLNAGLIVVYYSAYSLWCLGYWPHRRGPLLLAAGQQLIQVISYLEGVWKVGGDYSLPSLPAYKFFSSLLGQLLEQRRREGISPLAYLPVLKKSLLQDVDFQQRWLTNVHHSLGQFLILLAMLVFYVHFACYILQVTPGPMFLFCFYGYLASSFALYLPLLHLGYRRYLHAFDEWMRWVFTLRFTCLHGLPASGTEEGQLPCRSIGIPFQSWQQFLQQSLALTRREGHPIQGKLDYLLEEIAQQRSLALGQFLKKMDLLRFFISILVFLSSYFAFVYWLLARMWPAAL